MRSYPSIQDVLLIGDSQQLLPFVPDDSVQLTFTSPPYFNARPQYAIYDSYNEYLSAVTDICRQIYRVLEPGRFFVLNTSPVLVPRTKRSEESTRLPVPFDLNSRVQQIGFKFIDDIVWEKPEGAGWSYGRGRRFAADRQPLQYKPVAVTEYLMVYRKPSDKLIDWHIRRQSDNVRQASKIADGYEVTNVWRLSPARDTEHPAVFPYGLAERVIRYYSFENDLVLDPYAGSGTVGSVCRDLNRHFLLVEQMEQYTTVIKNRVKPKRVFRMQRSSPS